MALPDAGPGAEPETQDAVAPSRGAAWAERSFCALLLVVATYAVVGSLSLGLGSLDRPGPGLWPLLVACLLAASIVAALLQRPQPEPFGLAGSIKVATVPLAIVAFVALYPVIGFLVPAALMVIFLLRVVGNERWLISIVLGILATVLAHLLFAEVLGVNI